MNKPLVPFITLSLAVTMLPVLSSFGQEKTAVQAAETSIFKDKKLEDAVRQFVFEKKNTTRPIVAADVANLSVIKAKGAGITDLSGLEHCKRLASLELADNQIRDLAPLKGLGMIQLLDLANNQVRDISPLAGISALQYIELTGNKVADIKPLAGLTNMASLYLSGNEISDITPLFGLRRLSSLHLEGNRITRLDGIGVLNGLSTLSLSRNQITDVTPLGALNRLNYLFLEENRISDLTPLYDSAKKDQAGEKRFSPFLNLYVKGNPLKATARTQLADLKGFGTRVYQ